jgi:hypothetical protein
MWMSRAVTPFLLYTDGVYGADYPDQPRLTPASLATMLQPVAPDAQTLLVRVMAQATEWERRQAITRRYRGDRSEADRMNGGRICAGKISIALLRVTH